MAAVFSSEMTLRLTGNRALQPGTYDKSLQNLVDVYGTIPGGMAFLKPAPKSKGGKTGTAQAPGATTVEVHFEVFLHMDTVEYSLPTRPSS